MKIHIKLSIICLLFLSFIQITFATGATILPNSKTLDEAGKSGNDAKVAYCNQYYYSQLIKGEEKTQLTGGGSQAVSKDKMEELLSCAIITGNIHLWMIPYYIVYWIEFLIQMSGILAVLMFVIGGIYYILGGGLLQNISKDDGKKYMTWALMGMCLSFLAWVIVNVVLNFLSQ